MARKKIYMALLAVSLAGAALVLGCSEEVGPGRDDPWRGVTRYPDHTNHAHLYKADKFEDGPSVTMACLECHPQAADQVMATSHWNWLGDPETVPGHDKPVRIGKLNLINNFCISIEGNWPKCTKCHAGYGWKDASFDFSVKKNVDCLVCHDGSGLYDKGESGIPPKDVDLLAAAKSVRRPTRDNCGYCHFNGGGGNAVKHGDLDGSLAKPVERIDVHMGRLNLVCIDCHKTRDHKITGRMVSVSATNTNQVGCVSCHADKPHGNERLDGHTEALACQTCHLPEMAVKEATKVAWDWSTAGQDIGADDPHKYLKIKGSFIYAKNLRPEYFWFNGSLERYLKGDLIDPEKVTQINRPLGSIGDPNSKIWPFKVHRAKQPYDVKYKRLIVPKTVGKGGYWTDFDWIKAAELGGEASGLPFSGEFGFTETEMYWRLSHMIAPKERALQCVDCHGDSGGMDWKALGYDGDPAYVGGRSRKRVVSMAGGTDK